MQEGPASLGAQEAVLPAVGTGRWPCGSLLALRAEPRVEDLGFYPECQAPSDTVGWSGSLLIP